MKTKRVLSLLLASCLLIGMLITDGSSLPQAEAKTTMQYGLTIDENGNFRLNGKPFYGYGINGYAGNMAFDPFDDSYAVCLEICKKYDIPFIRIPITYGSIEEFRAYQNGDDYMFELSDTMLDMAEEAGVGIVVWLLTSQRYMNVVGEKASAQGDMDSKSMAFMKQWVADFVERYKDHPALWGYDLRNEGNLESDVYDISNYNGSYGIHQQTYGDMVGDQVTGFDCKPSETFHVMYREAAKEIRKQDSNRMISNGNAIMREASYHLHQAAQKRDENNVWVNDFTKDTLEQFIYMNEYFTPDPVDTFSFHIQMPKTISAYQYVLADVSLSYEELLKQYVALAKKNKKGLYYGEFGDMGVLTELDEADVISRTVENLEIMVRTGIQLGTLWQRNGKNAYISDEGHLSTILAELQKTNQKFKDLGLQNTEEYWATAAKQKAESSASQVASSQSAASVVSSVSTVTGEVSSSDTSSVVASVSIAESVPTTQDSTASIANDDKEESGGNGWVLWVVVIAIVVLLGAAGFLVYWFVLRKRGN